MYDIIKTIFYKFIKDEREIYLYNNYYILKQDRGVNYLFVGYLGRDGQRILFFLKGWEFLTEN